MTPPTTHRQAGTRDTASTESSNCRNVSRGTKVAFRPTSGLMRTFGLAAFMSVATATPSPSNIGDLKTRGTVSTRDSNDSSSGSSLSGGAIAGIVIGVIIFFAILEILWERERIMTWIRERKSPQSSAQLDPESNNPSFSEESKTHSTATLERQSAN